MKNYMTWMTIGFFLFSCRGQHLAKWELYGTVPLGDASPVGIAVDSSVLWISDPDNNQVIRRSIQSAEDETFFHFQRPMHIFAYQSGIYVPEFLTDSVKVIVGNRTEEVPIQVQLDAPAGVAVAGHLQAVADFYNHRIVVRQDGRFRSIGREGHQSGEFRRRFDLRVFRQKKCQGLLR